MSTDAWIATGVVALVFVLLAIGRHPPYLVLLGGLTIVLVAGVVDPVTAFAGYGNPGLVTVAILFVVAAGLRQTGALSQLVKSALGRPRSSTSAQLRMAPPVMLGSAFMNNTPVVAMLMPVVVDWCKAHRIAVSKLLLPLSYLAILGGLCTVIGTSTNIVVNGLLAGAGKPALGLFDISWVGVPCALAGAMYLLAIGGRLLPDRRKVSDTVEAPREYVVEMTVSPSGPLVGKSIEVAGLRNLPSLYLMEIHRGEQVLPAVKPTQTLKANDQLVFVGVVDSVVDVQRIAGLQPVTRQVFKLDSHPADRIFAEAVVSQSCPLLGKTIREGRFRTRYGAVVVAVSRNGERVPGRIGDIELRAGDSLLLEALPLFVEQNRNSKDFYLISRLDVEGPATKAQAPIALAILIAMVALAATGMLDMLVAGFLAAAAMVLTRCCSEETARKSIDWPLLHAIGAAFGLGHALDDSGAAGVLANTLLAQAGTNPWLALVLIYLTTALLTEFVTNNAAAIIVFPIALSTAEQLGVNHLPFVVAVMIAASASFATPLGYQTNLMVYGPGGYRITDFLKAGIPMSLVVGLVACSLAPLVWPF